MGGVKTGRIATAVREMKILLLNRISISRERDVPCEIFENQNIFWPHLLSNCNLTSTELNR